MTRDKWQLKPVETSRRRCIRATTPDLPPPGFSVLLGAAWERAGESGAAPQYETSFGDARSQRRKLKIMVSPVRFRPSAPRATRR